MKLLYSCTEVRTDIIIMHHICVTCEKLNLPPYNKRNFRTDIIYRMSTFECF
uniref:Uncharacterized protein n=1 Tax=Anguilla anguilla TaxID=7936 RepID=A0A0E9R2D2_ANGAN